MDSTEISPPHSPGALRALRINDPAPDFIARTTQGEKRLSDYRGRWLVLFSHPADFTPVCTSEFIALARRADAFEALGCDLMALSVDSLYSHLAWLKDIYRRFGVKVAFPIIEDPSMAIGHAFGMVDAGSSDSATVRASFVIDPDGIVRAVSWYPMNIGRSVDELLRLVTALQTADREQASTPAGWSPGEPLLEPAATTLDAALAHGDGDAPWYYRERGA
ncbi:peroxiredoxin [Brevundimonas mediterranea]|uniref:Thioredoxin peroxidase n=1 Tax=Brevundimonas mediterranea TaxID=74329 RepID=A0A7W6A2T0_9CAUL|nr:peroxiredoxin [Brevundimonas mediterranea]MBB3871639.1 peroxiredoxin (alkyl hydroperoxide reductase subunit C) [Brevundimonas mediterranea]